MSSEKTVFLPTVRITARAVVVRNGRILVQVKKSKSGRIYYTLPGGRLEAGETLATAACREAWEEVAAEVTVGRLLHVAELHKLRPEGLRHQVEHLFHCHVTDTYIPQMGPQPDSKQIGVRWADPVLEAEMFDPPYGDILQAKASEVYLGAIQNETS